LRIGFLAAIESLNPFRGINDADYLFYGLVYDYLFSLDEDGNPLPNLATDAAPDAYGANWTYTIRQNVSWHDGTPLTADDVAFSINYNIQNFWLLWAYEPYVNRVVQCEGGQTTNCGAQVTGPWQVTVYFDRPFVPGKALYLPIIQKRQWQGISASQAQYNYENLNPIGTGMYMADPNIGTQWQQNQPLLLHKNPKYHLGVPAIDDIYLIHFTDEASMVQALLTGALDVAEFTPAGYNTLAGKPNIDRQEALLSTQYWVEIGFQQQDATSINKKLNPARWDQNVRRALAKATNKDYIVQTIYQGKGVRGSTLMSPITPFWHYDPATDPSVNLTFDVAAANAMLDAAGYTTKDANGIRSASRSITVYDDNGEPKTVPAGQRLSFRMAVRQEYQQEQDTAKYLQAAWKLVGVELTYSVMTEPALSDAVYGGDVETYIWYWSGDPDPNYLLSIESGFTLDGWNDNYWNNATYNQLYVDHLAARDPVQRQAIVRAAEKLHYESAVYIILIYNTGTWAYRTDKYTGWGDWAAHPYRQLNAFWTGNPLFLDLKPIAAPTVSVSSASGRPGQPVTITGTIQDQRSGTWILEFGDGTNTTGTYPAGGTTVSVTHTYAAEGTYTVRLTADNGLFSRTQIATVTIQAVGNLKPDQVRLIADRTTGPPGTRINFTLSAHDEEGGTLWFNISYDDGSSDSVTRTAAPNAVTTVTFSHVYATEGSFFAEASVSDGQAVSDVQRIEIVIQSPAPAAAGLDPLYLGVGALVVIAVIAAIVALMIRRRSKAKEEEAKLPPPPSPPPPT